MASPSCGCSPEESYGDLIEADTAASRPVTF